MITSSRSWLLTINNPMDKGFSHDVIKSILIEHKIEYWCMCDEIGLKGETPHIHIYIYKESKIRFNSVKKWFPQAHIDFPNGTPKENRDYIRKEGKYKDSEKEKTNLKDTFEEFGECPCKSQGKRNDLEHLYIMIKDGLSDYEIIENEPKYMRRLDMINRTRQILLENEYKEKIRNVKTIYRYGKSGTGKTRSIFSQYGYDDVYRITDYNHPFDNYSNEKVIVFEEFYSSNVKIGDMLNYLDIYPLNLPCRYNNKVACYDTVYINSNIPLYEQYKILQKEHKEIWNAFLRRIKSVEIFGEKKEVFNSVEDWLNRNENEFISLNNKSEQIELPFI